MPNNNKNKGKRFERDIAKYLTKIYGLNFERVPSSGAFTGGKNSIRIGKLTEEQNLLSSGDIINPMELKTCTFECKFYKNPFSMKSLLTSNKQLDTWISQAGQDPSKYWFLVIKFNNAGSFIVYDPEQVEKNNKDVKIKLDGSYVKYKKYILTDFETFINDNKRILLNLKPIDND